MKANDSFIFTKNIIVVEQYVTRIKINININTNIFTVLCIA